MSNVLLSPIDKRNTLPYSRPTTPDHGHRVGVYGLGAIGYHVARNLANSLSSLPLFVYNRSPAKSERLATELGPNKISIVQSPAELVNSCDIMCGPFLSKHTHTDPLASASQSSRMTRWSSLHTSNFIRLSRYKFRVVLSRDTRSYIHKATSPETTKIFVEFSTVSFFTVTPRAL